MFGLSTGEILLIVVVLVVLFGAKRIPQLGEALGKGIRSLRKVTEAGAVDETAEKQGSPMLPGHDRAPAARDPAATADVKRT